MKLSKLYFSNADKRLAYMQLMRMDKPVGTYLLLWPTLWALWIAAEGLPPLLILAIFVGGVFLMRSAGCVINDFADRKVDGHVERTKSRPIASGRATASEALSLFFILVVAAFILVLFLNWQTWLLSVVALFLAALYPFMKRFTYLPQFVLGAAFSWAIPMAFMAVSEDVPAIAWLLYAINLIWTVAYDTLYAMVDRDDDVKIGVKSTAILFGRFDRLIVFSLQILMLSMSTYLGWFLTFSWSFYVVLIFIFAFFVWQQFKIKSYDKAACFKAFLDNNYVGMALFLGIALSYI